MSKNILVIAAHPDDEVLGCGGTIARHTRDGDEVYVVINMYRPEIVYTHYSGNVNIEHRIINEALITVCRPIPGYNVRTLLFFEIPSNSEWQISGKFPYFMPNWFVDISTTIEIKLKALECYKSDLRPYLHSRSLEIIENLPRWRGSPVGIEAAEAFVLGRITKGV